ncbi:DUF4260 domain-containing protein [Piscibacillus halophilus]|uniref:DUF4260 domain-containing protein n=1 Tax=Piscibacillus halophilus TaxID=571933 RepID=UPI00158AE334|nr:DUF4260 domain-containing protein [Piscibacillus halophilus]
MNRILLHFEGLTVLGIALYFYSILDFSWVLFLVLLLAPDFSMLGYLINERIGSVIYNLFHTYIAPAILLLGGIILSVSSILAIALIWIAHIGMDRTVGYGLKYPTGFKDTHLNRV